MDPELRTLLGALVEGQVKLAEGQVKLVEGQVKLAEVQVKLAEGQIKLAEGQGRLEAAMAETREDIKAFSTRMEMYTQAVMRGFTSAADRDGALQADVEDLKQRVAALEKHAPPGGGPKTRKPRASRSNR